MSLVRLSQATGTTDRAGNDFAPLRQMLLHGRHFRRAAGARQRDTGAASDDKNPAQAVEQPLDFLIRISAV